MQNKLNWLMRGGIGGSLLLIVACGASSENLPSSVPFSIQYKDPVSMKVTGTGCAKTPQAALRLSQNIAQYNLRSIIGNKRYLVSFREVNRYQENNQICIETEAESQAP